jgi:hypothetical protein
MCQLKLDYGEAQPDCRIADARNITAILIEHVAEYQSRLILRQLILNFLCSVSRGVCRT